MITECDYLAALETIRLYRLQTFEVTNAVQVIGFDGYKVDESGNVYNEKGRKLKPKIATGKSGRKQIQVSVKGNRALATIVATAYCKNPKNYTRLVFKDDNPLNCAASNLVWVSNSIFALNTRMKSANCPLGKGRPLIKETPEDAYIKAKDLDLKQYYKTQDEKFLQRIWKKIDSEMTMRGWNLVSTECYLYFIDRCKRNSLLGNPYAFVISMAQQKLKGYKKTLNTSRAKDARKLDSELVRGW